MKNIIYEGADGNINLLHPNPNMDIVEVAKKDVPTGVKYKILEKEDLPEFYWLGAWEYDFDTNSDGVGL